MARRSIHDSFIASLAAQAFAEFSLDAREQTLAMLRQPGVLTLVAERGRGPLGFAILHQRGAIGHLNAIAVVEEARGTGVGRELLLQVEHEACGRRVAELALVTAQANLAALELFLKAGFRVRERMSRYYATGHDAVALTKRL